MIKTRAVGHVLMHNGMYVLITSTRASRALILTQRLATTPHSP